MNQRLKALEDGKTPVGIEIRQVLATDFKGYEGILPPLAVLQEFINVTAAEQEKGKYIAEARGNAARVLTEAAGANYDELARAVVEEVGGSHDNAPNLDAPQA